MVEMGGLEPPFAACAPVSLTHGCSCRELQNAITTLPHLHEGVLVFPSRQIFSVPRFCQQITGAITASRLAGLTSGLRITHTTVPLNARHSRCPRRIGGIGRDRTHDLLITNELLCQLSYDTGSPPCLRPGGRADVRWRGLRPVAAFLRELHARHRVRCSELTGAALLTDGHI